MQVDTSAVAARPRTFGSTDLALLAMVFVWGINFAIIKQTLAEMSPLAFNGLRVSLAAIVMLVILRATEGDWRLSKGDWLPMLRLGLIGNTVYQLLFILGLDRTRAGNSSLILALVPVVVALLSAGLGSEKVRGRAWLGIVLSFAGIVLVVQGGGKSVGLTSGTLLGDVLTLGATICWALYTVLSKPLLEHYSPLRVSGLSMAMGAPLLVLASVPELIRQDWGTVSLQGWLGLLYSFSMALVFAYIVWSTGVRRIGGPRTAVYSNLIPVVAVTTAWLMLGEAMTGLQLVGAVVILTGVTLARTSARV